MFSDQELHSLSYPLAGKDKDVAASCVWVSSVYLTDPKKSKETDRGI